MTKNNKISENWYINTVAKEVNEMILVTSMNGPNNSEFDRFLPHSPLSIF